MQTNSSLNLGKVNRVRAIGEDLQGNTYDSLEQMWKSHIEATPQTNKIATRSSGIVDKSKEQWYKVAVDFWNRQPATVDGVLGGYEHIHATESLTSIKMIEDFKNEMPKTDSALDCGAGIGRVTKHVLSK